MEYFNDFLSLRHPVLMSRLPIPRRYWYGGDFVNRGGSGGSSYDLTRGGAAGTAFVANQQRPLSYRELKYNEETNEAYFQV